MKSGASPARPSRPSRPHGGGDSSRAAVCVVPVLLLPMPVVVLPVVVLAGRAVPAGPTVPVPWASAAGAAPAAMRAAIPSAAHVLRVSIACSCLLPSPGPHLAPLRGRRVYARPVPAGAASDPAVGLRGGGVAQ